MCGLVEKTWPCDTWTRLRGFDSTGGGARGPIETQRNGTTFQKSQRTIRTKKDKRPMERKITYALRTPQNQGESIPTPPNQRRCPSNLPQLVTSIPLLSDPGGHFPLEKKKNSQSLENFAHQVTTSSPPPGSSRDPRRPVTGGP